MTKSLVLAKFIARYNIYSLLGELEDTWYKNPEVSIAINEDEDGELLVEVLTADEAEDYDCDVMIELNLEVEHDFSEAMIEAQVMSTAGYDLAQEILFQERYKKDKGELQ